jgi:ABC-2 type transport system permease protein
MNRWRVNTLTVIGMTVSKELKMSAPLLSFLFKFVNDGARAAALAWIVYQSGNLQSLGFLMVGVALIAVWTGAVADGGWSLDTELYSGTLDFALISRAPLSLVLFSKMLAQILHEIPTGLVASVTVLLVARSVPVIANPAGLIISLVLVIIGIALVSTLLAGMVVLAGGRAGIFMGIVPFGAVISGFIVPVDQLPLGMEIIARLVPSSWAMDGVWSAVTGTGSWANMGWSWGISIIASAIWFVGAVYLCKLVEKRIRIEGTISA